MDERYLIGARSIIAEQVTLADRMAGKRDIGAIGEAEFARWAELEGFRVQKPQADRLGWDFLLESVPLATATRPLDAQNELPKFLIQVKSSERIGAPPRIKLSALKHLVDADMVAVVAVLSYEKNGRSPARTQIVHVDNVLIGEVLHRVRREEAKGVRDIHNVSLPVPLKGAVDIGVGGEGLAAELANMVGASHADYVAAKAAHRSTCGYDHRSVTGRFSVPGTEGASRVGALFLGGRRQLEVLDLTIERRRFGIALDNDRSEFQRAVLEVEAPALMTARIELESEDGAWVSMEVGFFAAPPLASPRRGPVRFANAFFEVVADFEAMSGNLVLDFDAGRHVALEEAVSIVEVGAILAKPGRMLTIHLSGTKLRLPLAQGEGPFRHWIPAAPVLRRILSAIDRAGRSVGRRIELRSFYKWVEEHLEFLALASTSGAQISFPRWPEDGLVDGQDCILIPLSLEFGGIRYMALVEMPILSVSRTLDDIRIEGGQPRVVEDVARSLSAHDGGFLDTAIERSKRDRGRCGPALVAGGLECWQSVVFSLA